MKIHILSLCTDVAGGAARATVTLAAGLGRRHEVELVSAVRTMDHPVHGQPEGVATTCLTDIRHDVGDRWRTRAEGPVRPSTLVHPEDRDFWLVDREIDDVLRHHIASVDADVLITTRPAFALLAARLAPDGVALITQEHMHLMTHGSGLLAEMRRTYPSLSAVVTVSAADRADHAAFLGGAGVPVYAISNALPDDLYPRSRMENKVVTAAGRLVEFKRFDRLIDAFARVVRSHPDWRLRIYGDGPEYARLSDQIMRLGLYNHVTLMRQTTDLIGELAKASIHTVSSEYETFGMTIIEAFACGVPVVAFDCPHGPPEIITSGHDGVLVPNGDIDGYAEALVALMADEKARCRMAANALVTAGRYDLAAVADRWEEMFADLDLL